MNAICRFFVNAGSGGSSGASFTPGGGATGQFGPGASSGGTLRNRPSNIEIFRRQQEQKPYYPPLR